MPSKENPTQLPVTQTTQMRNPSLSFQPSVDLITWGSVENPELFEKGTVKTKYSHYIAQQMKNEPVGHTSLRFTIPADPQVIKRLEFYKDKGLTYRESKAFVGVQNPDGTLSRHTIPVLEIYFSWWPKKFKNRTPEFDMYSELSNQLSEKDKDKKGSSLVNYQSLITPEHKEVIDDKNKFEKNLSLINELRNKLQLRKFTPFDINKIEFVIQLIDLCEDYNRVVNRAIDLNGLFKELHFELPNAAKTPMNPNLSYENGEFEKAIKILDKLYERYKDTYNEQLIRELDAHQQALQDNYEYMGQRPSHVLTLPLTFDSHDVTKLNAMKMLDTIEKLYTNHDYRFLTTNCARTARMVLVSGVSDEMKDEMCRSNITGRMLKKPKIETPTSIKDFGLLLQKTIASLSGGAPLEGAGYYLKLLGNKKMTPEHQVLIAKSLQFLKLLDELAANNRIAKKQATKLAKLAYDLTTNPDYHIQAFTKEWSAIKLTYGTPKDQRIAIKSLGKQLISSGEVFVKGKTSRKNENLGTISRYSLFGSNTTKPKDVGNVPDKVIKP